GINAAVYVGHSALRRFVRGDAASERAATADELEQMRRLVRAAMAAGAAGFSSSQAPTHTDQLGRPVPSRHAAFDEVLALAEAAGEGGAGSIAFLAETAVQGYDARDRERLVQLAHRSGLPVVVQGMGFRPGARERWDDQSRFLAEARAQGAAIYSMLRTQPFMRPFNWRRGTSLFDGVFHWRDLSDLPAEEPLARLKDAGLREKLRAAPAHPNTDSKPRGLLARGYAADIMLLDPTRIGLGKKQLVRDVPGGEERWQVLPEGIVRVIVNGETIVKDGKLTDTRPGRVLHVGNPAG